MNFETLLFIHKMLKEEEQSANNAYTAHRDYWKQLKECRASKQEIADAEEMMNLSDRYHIKALRALTDFTEHEWR